MIRISPIRELTKNEIKSFWSKVAITANREKCWEWQAGKYQDGYGMFDVDNPKKAHRVAYTLFFKQDISNILCLHKCDNPSCVNPNHLFLGTQQDNIDDKKRKGREAKGKTHWANTNPELFKKVHGGWLKKLKDNPHLVARGEKSGTSKLTSDQVLEIRQIHQDGLLSQTEIGKKFGVDRTCIGLIVRRKNWKHI